MKDILFTPFKIGSITVKNRLVRSACSERGSDNNGEVSAGLVKLYEELAKGGAGLVITGYAFVHPSGRCNPRQIGIHDDDNLPSLRKLTDAFHQASPDAKIFIQIVHGGRQCRAYNVSKVLAPSPVPFDGVTPHPLTEKEIEELIESFTDSAQRASIAGFDGVQLHAAHGFLISQFLSSFTNRRKDSWGGSRENRRRFFLEIIKKIRSRLGGDFPITTKINCSDFLEGIGVTPDEAAETIAAAQEAGLDAVEISGGILDTPPEKGAVRKGIDKREKEAYFLEEAKIIRKAVSIPMMLAGGIRSAQTARNLLINGDVDFVSMCRPFIREPDLPNKFMTGISTKALCVSCQGCLINTGEMVKCVLEEV